MLNRKIFVKGIIKKRVLWLMLLGCMMLPIDHAQASDSNKGTMMLTAGIVAMAYLYAQHQGLWPFASDVDARLSEKEIMQFLELKFTQIGVSNDVNIPLLARILDKSNTADLESVVNDVQKLATQDKINMVTTKHFYDAHLNKKIGSQIPEFFSSLLNVITDKRTKAIHEAGHAVSGIYNQQNGVVYHAEMMTRSGGSGGFVHTKQVQMFDDSLANRNFDLGSLINIIVSAVCGGVAQQVFGLPESFKGKNLENLLKNFGCETDIKGAKRIAEYIIDENQADFRRKRVLHDYQEQKRVLTNKQDDDFMNILNSMDTMDEKLRLTVALHNQHHDLLDQAHEEFNQNIKLLSQEQQRFGTVDKILAECYDIAWDFITEHKDEVQKIADLLMEKEAVSGDEIYNLLGVDKPLYDFEEGPLPLSLLPNYELRGLYDIKD